MKDPRLNHAGASGKGAPSVHSGPPDSDPFAEYMWMEHEEEFDRQVEEELWEEDFMERCFQEMLDEEEAAEWFVPARDLPDARGQRADRPTTNIPSVLNPDAKEFTPGIQKHAM
ncbi:polyadenylate-binding protein-interacting protein 2-like [Hippocampus zosterae]|uniref:polyadenylate-binding protein-interacting protein 2-like n=1 Tax=Hippocampus zosterae TaxID=109293 RepID=UPI00223E7038|nr:polyadenylate-binding protein-interacting protein 2-like [Hippocampus zosterae]